MAGLVTVCSLNACDNPSRTRGYCARHYRRLIRSGTPDFPTDEDRFWNSIEKTESSCWIWQKSCFPSGYAQFKAQKKNWRAHRYAYELIKGKIPEGLTLDHLCRVKNCVNPDHLEAVSFEENNKRVPKDIICQRGHVRIPGTRRCGECSKVIPSRHPEARRKAYLKKKERTHGSRPSP